MEGGRGGRERREGRREHTTGYFAILISFKTCIQDGKNDAQFAYRLILSQEKGRHGILKSKIFSVK